MPTSLPMLITRPPESFARAQISKSAPSRLDSPKSSFRETLAKAGLSEKNNFKAKNNGIKPDFKARPALDDDRKVTSHEVAQQDSAALIDSRETHVDDDNQSDVGERVESNSERSANRQSAETADARAQGNQDGAQNSPSSANNLVGTHASAISSGLLSFQSSQAGQLPADLIPANNVITGNPGNLDPGIVVAQDYAINRGVGEAGMESITTNIRSLRSAQVPVATEENPNGSPRGQMAGFSSFSEPTTVAPYLDRVPIEQNTTLLQAAAVKSSSDQTGQGSGDRVQNADAQARGASPATAHNPVSDLAGKLYDAGEQSRQNSDRSDSQSKTNPAQSRALQVDAAVRLENATGQSANLVASTQTNMNKASTSTIDSGGLQNTQGADGSSSLTNRMGGVEDSGMMSRVMRSLTAMMNQRGGVMNMRLDPPELGELRIQMVLGRGSVSATFEATNEQTQAMLNKNLSALRTALESQGLTVERLHVHINQGSGAQAQPEDASDDQSRQGGSGQGENQQSDQQGSESGDRHRGQSEFSSLIDGLENFSLEQLAGNTAKGDQAS